MPNVALIPGSETRVALLTAVVDGFPAVHHELATTTGGEPLEDGREVTDHAVARQSKLKLTGIVSDLNGGQRQREAWDTIRRLHRSVTPIEVITEWGVYPEMLIVRAEAPQTRRGMEFTLELEEVIRVGVTETALPAAQLSGPASGRSGVVERGRVPLGTGPF